MKNLTNFIQEKYLIDNDIQTYTCQPKYKYELRKILKERLAKDKDADLNDIDVSKITDMGCKGFPENKGLFQDLDPHNIDISEWNVSNVTNMDYMFYHCKNFTGKGLENWNMSKVKNMESTFSGCQNFEGKGLENWNVSNVEDMRMTFYLCENFNADLSNWNVFKVIAMSFMFKGCKNFIGKGLENWNVSNVKDMQSMFYNCYSLKNKPSWYKG